MHDVVSLLQALVQIDSINPDLVPGAAGEAQIAQFVAEWFTQAGLEVMLDEPLPGRPSVVAIARGSGGGRSLMLNAHMDTVGVAGMAEPFSGRITGNRLYGRGAYDMKGSLAACMVAAAEARTLGLRGDLIVTAVADEEYASIGTASIAQRWHADAAIVTEPTHMELCVAHKGFVWLEIETHGVAAHGSLPDKGVDAIAKMGHVLVGLEHLDRSLRATPSHPLLQSGSLHASLITGGQELSSYPEVCRLAVERRTVPSETAELVEAQIRAILAGLAQADSQFRAEVRSTLERPPFAVPTSAPIVQEVRRQAQAFLGIEPPIVGAMAWMDSAILSQANIPTVIFGPSGAGAHAVEEWVDLDEVAQCAQIYLATARSWCA